MYEAKVILVLLVKHVYIGIVKYKRKQLCLATNRQHSTKRGAKISSGFSQQRPTIQRQCWEQKVGELHLLLSDHKQHSCHKFLLSKLLDILLLECVLNKAEKDFGGRVCGK